jgi:hypothetical protein
VTERRHIVEHLADRGVARWVALVEQRGDLVGVELRLHLFRLLRRQWLFDLGFLLFLVGLLELVGGWVGAGSGSGSAAFCAVALISAFSVILGAGVSAGFASAIFSTSGLGISSLGAALTPLVNSEKSLSLTRSTGKVSGGMDSK